MRARSTKCVVNVINNSVHVRPVVYPSNSSLSIRAGMTVKSPVWDLFFHSDHSTSSSLDFYWKDGELNLEKQKVSVKY
jgi:hypothetical protein